jgi:hypothetical protein
VNREQVEKVANAVLYEGYMLYPYRPSAIKNKQRWSFGILYPPGYDEVRCGTERCFMHSECLIQAKENASIHCQLRFLQLISRQTTQPPASSNDVMERSVEFTLEVKEGLRQEFRFTFSANQTVERSLENFQEAEESDDSQHQITATISASVQEMRSGLIKLTIEVTNTTSSSHHLLDRNRALEHAMLSAHTILKLRNGEFVSLMDPPSDFRNEIAGCSNVGNFPVLAGEEGQHDTLLCSPIILYDYPQIASESAGDFFDATEMDEMLTLRVMTLTEEEKDEMRLAGGHARDLLLRTEQSAREQLARTHGTIRSMRPMNEEQ